MGIVVFTSIIQAYVPSRPTTVKPKMKLFISLILGLGLQVYSFPVMEDSLTLHQELLLGGTDLIHPQITMIMATTAEDLVINTIKLMVNVVFAETHTSMNQELMKPLVVFMRLVPLLTAIPQDK